MKKEMSSLMARTNRCKGESRRYPRPTRKLKYKPISILIAESCRGQTASACTCLAESFCRASRMILERRARVSGEPMRAVVQRVSRAQVTVGKIVTGQIGSGVLVLLGVSQSDNQADADYLADKIAGLR